MELIIINLLCAWKTYEWFVYSLTIAIDKQQITVVHNTTFVPLCIISKLFSYYWRHGFKLEKVPNVIV